MNDKEMLSLQVGGAPEFFGNVAGTSTDSRCFDRVVATFISLFVDNAPPEKNTYFRILEALQKPPRWTRQPTTST